MAGPESAGSFESQVNDLIAKFEVWCESNEGGFSEFAAEVGAPDDVAAAVFDFLDFASGLPTVLQPRAGGSPGLRRDVIPGYELVEVIGQGGMGTVWAARRLDGALKRPVAVKICKYGLESQEHQARFEVERQSLALMDHPNIAGVYDAGMTRDNRPYLCMEYIKGIPITRYCDDRRCTIRERLGLFIEVCRAVQHAHQRGIIHRDITPANVLVAEQNDRPIIKIIDFGLAKPMHGHGWLIDKPLETARLLFMGTKQYASPEQACPDALDIDTRSDVYSLGVLLYELLTGTTPLTVERVRTKDMVEIVRIIREEDAPLASARLNGADETCPVARQRRTDPRELKRTLKGDLDAIAAQALEKDRRRRYDGVAALADDLERYLRDEAVMARRQTSRYRLGKAIRRNRTAFAAGTCAFVLAVCTIGWLISLNRQAHQRDAERLRQLANERRLTEELKAANAEQEAASVKLEERNTQLSEQAYLASIEQVGQRLREGNIRDAMRLLDECDNEHKGWEHAYLKGKCDESATPPIRVPRPIHWARFDTESDRVLTVDELGQIDLWDFETQTKLGSSAQSPGVAPMPRLADCFYADFDGRGQFIITASRTGAIRLLDNETLAAVGQARQIAEGGLTQVAVLDRGQKLLALADRRLSLWRIATDEQRVRVFQIELPAALRDTEFTEDSFAVHPDSQHVVLSLNGPRLYHMSTGRFAELTSTASEECQTCAVKVVQTMPAQDENDQESGSGRKRNDAPVEAPIVNLDEEPDESVAPVMSFAPDGSRVAFVLSDIAYATGMQKQTACVCEDTTFREFSSKPFRVTSLLLGPGGSLVVGGLENGQLRIWDADGELGRTLNGHLERVTCLTRSRDGYLCSASADRTLRFWKPLRDKDAGVDYDRDCGGKITDIWSVDEHGSLMITGKQTRLQLVDAVSFEPNAPVTAAAAATFFGGGGTLYPLQGLPMAAFGDELLPEALRDTPFGRVSHTGVLVPATTLLDTPGTAEPEFAAGCLSRHRDLIALVGRNKQGDEELRLIRIRDEQARIEWTWPPEHSRDTSRFSIDAVMFANDEQYLLVKWTADDQQRAVLLDQGSGSATLPPVEDITAACVSPRAEQLAIAESDGSISIRRFLDEGGLAAPPKRLWGLPAPASCMAFSEDGRRLVTSSADGTVRLWDVDSQREIGILHETGRAHTFNAIAFGNTLGCVFAADCDRRIYRWGLPAQTTPRQQLASSGSGALPRVESAEALEILTKMEQRSESLMSAGDVRTAMNAVLCLLRDRRADDITDHWRGSTSLQEALTREVALLPENEDAATRLGLALAATAILNVRLRLDGLFDGTPPLVAAEAITCLSRPEVHIERERIVTAILEAASSQQQAGLLTLAAETSSFGAVEQTETDLQERLVELAASDSSEVRAAVYRLTRLGRVPKAATIRIREARPDSPDSHTIIGQPLTEMRTPSSGEFLAAGMMEVTHGDWRAVIERMEQKRAEGSELPLDDWILRHLETVNADGSASAPLTGVSQPAAAAFCNVLSLLEGLSPCYEIEESTYLIDEKEIVEEALRLKKGRSGYRLPRPGEFMSFLGTTETRREEKAYTGATNGRGAVTRPRPTVELRDPWCAAEGAWCRSNSGGQPHPVAQTRPNRHGFFDLIGNVRELLEPDVYIVRRDQDLDGLPEFPQHVGGAAFWAPQTTSAQYASSALPFVLPAPDIGFRIVRVSEAPTEDPPGPGAGILPPAEDAPPPAAADGQAAGGRR